MNVQISVDMSSPVPPFEQVRSQLASLITSGELPADTRLPTVRDLAADLGLAVGTVARAYRELESIGLVASRRRTGTVVAQGILSTPEPVQNAIDHLVQESQKACLSDDTVIALLRSALITGSRRT